MSYQGYTQMLCANGHQLSCDAFDDPPDQCPHCQSALVWWNMVDQTNGEEEGYVELQVKKLELYHTCACGMTHVIAAATYHIPSDAGHMTSPPNAIIRMML